MSKLKVEDLGKSYDGNVILENISFAAEPGDSIAFVSPSGSGKSTLLSMLGLLLSSTTGTVVVDGQDSDALGDKELSRLRRETFGFVFQHTQLVGSLRAVENVMAPANFAGKLPFDAREREMCIRDRVHTHLNLHCSIISADGACSLRSHLSRLLLRLPHSWIA